MITFRTEHTIPRRAALSMGTIRGSPREKEIMAQVVGSVYVGWAMAELEKLGVRVIV